ncbi:MAG: hypothetical protein IJD92_04060 [Bacilli bacterium]|nr:hypothetical protein [Bacilli bacterium]
MKKISLYIIICLLVIMLRDNICYFYGNILGLFKLNNNYYDAIITLKDEEIENIKKDYTEFSNFNKRLDTINYNYKISKVIYKETYNTNKYKIEYGKKDGISNGLAIINEHGLVGKITDLDNTTSELTTLKDLEDISVVVNNSYGKLNYSYEDDIFIINDISNYDKVYINDKVYTSTYGTIKEKIYIGKVTKVENDTISKKVYVKSDVNFNKLNYLLIVGDFK